MLTEGRVDEVDDAAPRPRVVISGLCGFEGGGRGDEGGQLAGSHKAACLNRSPHDRRERRGGDGPVAAAGEPRDPREDPVRLCGPPCTTHEGSICIGCSA